MRSVELRPAPANHVVKLRRRMPQPVRQDADFLPAALEIIETPASPLGRAVGATIIAFLCIAILWSIQGQVDIIATAEGRIIPDGKSKTIQPFETGVVRAIKVAEGQSVEAGDVLVEIDPTTDESDRRRLANAYAQDRLDILRLEALLAGRADLTAPAAADVSLVANARDQMQAQAAEARAKLDALDRQAAQKRAEGLEVKAAIAKLEATLPLLGEQRDIRAALLGNQYGSRLSYLQAQQQVVEGQHELNIQRHRLEENAASLAALGRQRDQTAAEIRKGLLVDLAKAQVQANEHREEIAKAEMKRALRTLRAPVAGTVQDLAVHTLGGVVTPAQRLLTIVPRGAKLSIEASLSNQDIGFVHPGQDVAIKVETFNFTRYGLLNGTVTDVSRDAVVPTEHEPRERRRSGEDRQAAELPFVAHIALAATGVATEQGTIALEPGMAVTAEIVTGRRRVIDYVLSPLRRMRRDSLTER